MKPPFFLIGDYLEYFSCLHLIAQLFVLDVVTKSEYWQFTRIASYPQSTNSLQKEKETKRRKEKESEETRQHLARRVAQEEWC